MRPQADRLHEVRTEQLEDEDARAQGGWRGTSITSGTGGKSTFGRTRHGEERGHLVWCRKCSGRTRCLQGPKLTNRSRPEKKETQEYGKMLKIIVKLEERRV